MNLIIPNNIFATLFVLSISEEQRPTVTVKESSLISNELELDKETVALLPSLDLLKRNDLYVSSKLGIGFEEVLSNSYLYFSDKDPNMQKVLLKGDVSSNEVILIKIILKERYNVEPEILLDSKEKTSEDSNYLISGNLNWQDNRFENGVSFDEQVSDFINYPYLNYVFVSTNEEILKQFNKNFKNVTKSIISNLDEILNKINLDTGLSNFVKSEINSVYFDLTENELEGLEELYKLVYYHQVTDDIFDIKFVEWFF